MNIFVFVICTLLFSSTVVAKGTTTTVNTTANSITTAVNTTAKSIATTVSTTVKGTTTTVNKTANSIATAVITTAKSIATTVSKTANGTTTTVFTTANGTTTTVNTTANGTTTTVNTTANGTTTTVNTTANSTTTTVNTTANGTTTTVKTTANSIAATINSTAAIVKASTMSKSTGVKSTIETNGATSAAKSFSITTPTTKLTTLMHPIIVPNWDDVKLEIPLSIVINDTFKDKLNHRDSIEYTKREKKFKNKLNDFYKDTPYFKEVDIKGFSNGSIKCLYSVVLNTKNLTKKSLGNVINYIKEKKTTDDELSNITGIGQIEVKKTVEQMKKDLKKANAIFTDLCGTYGTKLCKYDHKCKFDENQYQQPYCVYKCNLEKEFCGDNGICSVDKDGKKTCKCKEDPLYVFHGERCDIKEEKLLLSKNYIIAITAGGGGAIILILFIAMICLCRKWNKAKKATQFYRNRSTKSLKNRESVAYEDDGMQMENSRIENVHMGKYGYDNNSYMVDSAPSTDDSSMRYEKGRYYRVVKDPELGADTLIYQPSNLNIPIQRESTISRDDEPDPLRTHYDYIDTDSVYKIKRPNVRTNTFDRNGHPRTVL